MGDPAQSNRLWPQVYVHLEFGISWSPQHAPNHHGVAYQSRRFRKQPHNTRRAPPTLDSNLLAAPPVLYPAQQQSYQVPYYNPELLYHHPPTWTSPLPYESQPQHHPQHHPQPREQRWRGAEPRPSSDRRRSAPPSTAPAAQHMTPPRQTASFPLASAASASPATSLPRQTPEVWKPLPATPSRYRLGEETLPWTPAAWPMGHEPIGYPADDADEPTPPARRPPPATAAIPSLGPPSPGPPSPRPRSREDPDRVRQLEALSAAMVTVDNGLEGLWWAPGWRSPPPLPPQQPATAPATPVAGVGGVDYYDDGGGGGGGGGGGDDDGAVSPLVDVVSPVSDCSTALSSPPPPARWLAASSDELFLHG